MRRSAAAPALDATPEPDSLAAAWAAAEAALPEGWRIERLERYGKKWAVDIEPCPGCGGESAEGDTPAAALHALARRLAERTKR